MKIEKEKTKNFIKIIVNETWTRGTDNENKKKKLNLFIYLFNGVIRKWLLTLVWRTEQV